MLFLSKTILKNFLFLLKYPILAVLALGKIQNFQISSKKSFIILTTGRRKKYLGNVGKYFDEEFSVTRWLNYFTIFDLLQLRKFAQKSKQVGLKFWPIPNKSSQFNQFRQSGEFSPNLITLMNIKIGEQQLVSEETRHSHAQKKEKGGTYTPYTQTKDTYMCICMRIDWR